MTRRGIDRTMGYFFLSIVFVSRGRYSRSEKFTRVYPTRYEVIEQRTRQRPFVRGHFVHKTKEYKRLTMVDLVQNYDLFILRVHAASYSLRSPLARRLRESVS